MQSALYWTCITLALVTQHAHSEAVPAMKAVKEVMRKPPNHWVGDGFHVVPVYADKAFTKEISPFLMFDYAAPKHFPATRKRLGVGQHPHRGFETVTLAFQGEVEHGDNKGNRGVIGAGDIQWMTAAQGIVHEEFHSTKFAETGGMFEFCQLWVNLPASKKMMPAQYQPILDKEVPRAPLFSSSCDRTEELKTEDADPLAEGYVRVIAGDFRGTKGAAVTQSPINMWDIKINKQKSYDFDIQEGHNTIVFVRKGSIEVQGSTLKEQDVALMDIAGKTITIKPKQDDVLVLILSGEPFDEPIAARGPFVMNTQKELQQAMMDYQMGRNGF